MIKTLSFFILISFNSVLAKAQRINGQPSQSISFITNADSFFNATLQHTKPYFLYFTASWCAPCKQLQAITFADTAVINHVNKNVTALKVDVDVDKKLRQKYYVSEYPTLIIFDKNGEIKMRFEGFFTASTFMETLKKLDQ